MKSRVVAGILGILLGCLGIQEFYCGNIGFGILSVVFCWTGIPAIVGLIRGILFLVCKDDKEFNRKYCK